MFVLDASVLANWCFPDEFDPHAAAALELMGTETAIAPLLLWFEVRNVFLTAERRNRLTEVQTASFLQQIGELPIDTDRDPDGAAVLGLARAYGLTVYDAAYLELAHRKALPLATLDGALGRAARAVEIPLVGETP